MRFGASKFCGVHTKKKATLRSSACAWWWRSGSAAKAGPWSSALSSASASLRMDRWLYRAGTWRGGGRLAPSPSGVSGDRTAGKEVRKPPTAGSGGGGVAAWRQEARGGVTGVNGGASSGRYSTSTPGSRSSAPGGAAAGAAVPSRRTWYFRRAGRPKIARGAPDGGAPPPPPPLVVGGRRSGGDDAPEAPTPSPPRLRLDAFAVSSDVERWWCDDDGSPRRVASSRDSDRMVRPGAADVGDAAPSPMSSTSDAERDGEEESGLAVLPVIVIALAWCMQNAKK